MKAEIERKKLKADIKVLYLPMQWLTPQQLTAVAEGGVREGEKAIRAELATRMQGEADRREYYKILDSLRVTRLGNGAAELSWKTQRDYELTARNGRPTIRRRKKKAEAKGKWVMKRGKLHWMSGKMVEKQKKKRMNRFGKLVKQAHHEPRPEVMPDNKTLSAALQKGAVQSVKHLLAKHANSKPE